MKSVTSRKEVNKLIGSIDIPLNKVPIKGNQQWYTLEKTDKKKQLGDLHIGLSFGFFGNPMTARREHRVLVKQFVLEHLAGSKDYQWTGKFCAPATSLLIQHAIQGGLSEGCVAFIRWSLFCEVHNSHRLSFVAFNKLLDVLASQVKNRKKEHEESQTMFWSTLSILVVSVFDWLMESQNKTLGDRSQEELVTQRHMLEFLTKIDDMLVPLGDGFQKTAKGYDVWNFQKGLISKIQESANVWFESILKCEINSEMTHKQKLLSYIDLVDRVERVVDLIFSSMKNSQYADHLLQFYDNRLNIEIQPFITAVCGNLAPVTDEPEEDQLTGKSILKIFTKLQILRKLALEVSTNWEDLKLKDCHLWFSTAVKSWLAESIYKAKVSIAKAIELDTLVSIGDLTRNSTSAVCTAKIFSEVFKFWQDLQWPDASSGFHQSVVEEICGCCSFYTEKTTERVAEFKKSSNVGLTKDWCHVINNLKYMRNNLEKLVEEVCLDPIIRKSLEKQHLQIETCFDDFVSRMSPKLIVSEATAYLQDDTMSMKESHLENTIAVLNAELSPENFETILDKIWLEICKMLDSKTKLTKALPQSCVYTNLLKAINSLLERYQCNHEIKEQCLCQVARNKFLKKLQLNGYNTDDLIHQFYIERLQTQKNVCGSLTIQCFLENNLFLVEILNARNLEVETVKIEGRTKIYAELYMLPAHKFQHVKALKTKPIEYTMFPLFDEMKEIHLTKETKAVKNALLMIRLKVKPIFGCKDYFIGDCLVSIDQILENDGESQIHLPLQKPGVQDYASAEVLYFRKSDKKAQQLLKKYNK